MPHQRNPSRSRACAEATGSATGSPSPLHRHRPAPVTAPRRHQLYHPIARTSLHRHCHSTAPTVAAPARIFTEEREIAGTSSSTGEGPLPLLSALSCKSRTCCITCKEKKRRNPTDLLSDDPKVLTNTTSFQMPFSMLTLHCVSGD